MLAHNSFKITDDYVELSLTPTGAAKVDGSAVVQPVSAASLPLPTGAATEVTLAEVRDAVLALSSPVAANCNITSVNRINASTTFLVANPSRKGATIWNDASANLFVKFGTGASDTSFTVRLSSNSYYEVPFGYTGMITGIWATAGAGAARISELS